MKQPDDWLRFLDLWRKEAALQDSNSALILWKEAMKFASKADYSSL